MNEKMNCYRIFILFFFILLPTNSFAIELRTFNNNVRSAYSQFCKGNYDEFNQEIKHLDPSQENYLSEKLSGFVTKAGLNDALNAASMLPDDLNSVPEDERIFAAAALMQSHTQDISKVSHLLNFQSSDLVKENIRLSVESYLDISEGHPELALKKRIDAFNSLPFLSEVILMDIMSLGSQDKNAELILSPYFGFIDQLPDNDSTKFLMLACKEIAISKWQHTELIFSHLKTAYELCRHDPTAALSFSSVLIYQKQYDEAEKILNDQINLGDFHSPNIDLDLAKIYIGKNEKEKAIAYLQKAEENKFYLTPEKRRELDNLNMANRNIQPLNLIIIILATFLGAALLFFYIWKNRKLKFED